MKKLTVLLFLALFSFANAQDAPQYNAPNDIIHISVIDQYVSENLVDFGKWEKAYHERVKAAKGTTYPKSGIIHTSSNRAQEKANKIAYYASIRAKSGDTLVGINESYIIFKNAKPALPKKSSSRF